MVFHYAPSRAHEHVETLLAGFRGTLLSDGYAAYEAYVRRHALLHAQCWAHCRRTFTEAGESEPEAVAEALRLIGVLYTQERAIRQQEDHGPGQARPAA